MFSRDIAHTVSRSGRGGGVDRADQRAVMLYEAVTATIKRMSSCDESAAFRPKRYFCGLAAFSSLLRSARR